MASKTFSTGDVLTASDVTAYLNAGKAWSTYTPALTAVTTNPTLGSGSTASGRYIVLGTFCHVTIQIIFGSSGTAAGSGFYSVSLPVTANASSVGAQLAGYLRDNSAGTFLPCIGGIDPAGATTIARIRYPNGLAAPTSSCTVNEAGPWAWAASDELHFSGVYECA